jgi:hypothetical protein
MDDGRGAAGDADVPVWSASNIDVSRQIAARRGILFTLPTNR